MSENEPWDDPRRVAARTVKDRTKMSPSEIEIDKNEFKLELERQLNETRRGKWKLYKKLLGN